MHPFSKCCGMYCSCLMVVGIVFFAILAALEASKNPFLNRHHPEESGQRVFALGMAMLINAVVFIGCFTCTNLGLKAETALKAKEDAERENALKEGQLDIF